MAMSLSVELKGRAVVAMFGGGVVVVAGFLNPQTISTDGLKKPFEILDDVGDGGRGLEDDQMRTYTCTTCILAPNH